jgi:hypothetical protein
VDPDSTTESIDGEVAGHPAGEHPRGERDHPGATDRGCGTAEIYEEDRSPIQGGALDHNGCSARQHQSSGDSA